MNVHTSPLATNMPTFALDSWPIIDWTYALKNIGGNQSILREMVEIMVKDEIPTMKAAFAKAHSTQDWANIENLAHKMRGGAIYMGLLKMKHACQYLEESCHTQQPLVQLEMLYTQVMAVCDASEATLKDWLQST